MKIKECLKKRLPFLSKVKYKILNIYVCLLTIISPSLNTKYWYKKKFGQKLNLKNPQTFNEKLLWLKLKVYNNDPKVIQCADKCAVREYIKQRGIEEILVNVHGIYEKADDIPWEELPDKFALKWNFGAGMNIICPDKSNLDFEKSAKKMKRWGKRKIWLQYSEMQYKYAPKRIICEEFIETANNAAITDYKLYCFNGVPKAILVMTDRGTKIKAVFKDFDWCTIGKIEKYKEEYEPSRPSNDLLEKMFSYAKTLSDSFPFVRVDFYIENERIYFGEMTFTPAGGIYTAQIPLEGKSMGEHIELPLL